MNAEVINVRSFEFNGQKIHEHLVIEVGRTDSPAVKINSTTRYERGSKISIDVKPWGSKEGGFFKPYITGKI